MSDRPETPPDTNDFDIFLAHGNGDKPQVLVLHRRLEAHGFTVFLDNKEIEPGEAWINRLGLALRACRSFLICLGSEGLGRWAECEVEVALSRATQDPSFRVIPVILPGGSQASFEPLSPFLKNHHAVDLSDQANFDTRFDRLCKQIYEACEGRPLQRNHRPLPIGDIARNVEILQSRFSDSIAPYLAGGRLIARKETQQLLEGIEDPDRRLFVVHGSAGSGKSGLLLELAHELETSKTVYLPLRLDEIELEGNPERFARGRLSFPASVGTCLEALAEEADPVLLIDQLDSLRWTGSHSAEAWHLCREMIAEALSWPRIKVVVCCRTFDLETDPQLRAWENEAKQLSRVEVGLLDLDDVTIAVCHLTGSPQATDLDLRPPQWELLRHVHHLQMWMSIYQSRKRITPFNTSWKLLEEFWKVKRSDLEESGIRPERRDELEKRIVAALENGTRLSAPVRRLDLSRNEINTYQHHHVLRIDDAEEPETFRLAHQSYQEYLTAKSLLSSLDKIPAENVEEQVLIWLGKREHQSLFRREQLRLLLVALRAENHQAYSAILDIFLSYPREDVDRIRFHLRSLTLQFLRDITEVRDHERERILGLVDDSEWREHVLDDVVRGKPEWYAILDEAGYFETWLAGEDQKLRESALDQMTYVLATCGNRIERLLRPYLDKSETWNHHIRWVFSRANPNEDTDALFDLRLALIERGLMSVKFTNWKQLALSNESRLVELIFHRLLWITKSLISNRDFRIIDDHSGSEWNGLTDIDLSAQPLELQVAMWKSVILIVSVMHELREQYDQKETLETRRVAFDTIRPVIDFLRNLGTRIAKRNWKTFIQAYEPLREEARLSEILFFDSLTYGPLELDFADWALEWLMTNPRRPKLRLQASSGKWALSGRLVERLSPVCSDSRYSRFEQWLLDYKEPDLIDSYQRRNRWFTSQQHLRYPSDFGRTTHALLAKVPENRLSDEGKRRQAELSRKFGDPNKTDYFLGDIRPMGSYIHSPISETSARNMTLQSWRRLAVNNKFGSRLEAGIESSLWSFSMDFKGATRREPSKLGRLLCEWPENGHKNYVLEILSGLADPLDERDRPDDWAPPSLELLEEIFDQSAVQDLIGLDGDSYAASAFCNLIRRFAEYDWSDSTLHHLIQIANDHPDPTPGSYPAGGDWSDDEEDEYFRRLDTNAPTGARGHAGFAVHSLLFEHPELFTKLRSSIESLVRDPHPAVRVAGIAACLPVLKLDRDLAIELVLEACDGHDELLASAESRRFFSYTCNRDLLPTFERMARSDHVRVARAGASWTTVLFLTEGHAEKLFEECVAGATHVRHGIAQVASNLVENPRYSRDAARVMLRLANDPEKKVKREISRGLGKLRLELVEQDPATWEALSKSKAFQAHPEYLFDALEEQVGDLIPFAECLLAAGASLTTEAATMARDELQRVGRESRRLPSLLLRLYEQTRQKAPRIHDACLDLWDLLLERRLISAMSLTHQLDQT